ncbi:MAG: outer membrane lipoprotein chaperone LolA [Desulfobulbaceae bacterium]|nr:outer membrane lipoprotein chaperone LolA [Desulfobulbaceae bacterium]
MPRFFLPVLMLLLSCSDAGAAAISAEDIARKLQETYEKSATFQADFTQTSSLQQSRRQRNGEGSMIIAKPGLMRWDYRQPDKQVFLCDGQTMSMYFAQAAQMMVMPAKEYLQSDVTYAFFLGTGDILRDFEPRLPKADYCCGESPALQLFPRLEHGQVEHLDVWLDERSLVRRLKIADHFGSVTELNFTNIRLNQKIDRNVFKFTPPANTEIVKQ